MPMDQSQSQRGSRLRTTPEPCPSNPVATTTCSALRNLPAGRPTLDLQRPLDPMPDPVQPTLAQVAPKRVYRQLPVYLDAPVLDPFEGVAPLAEAHALQPEVDVRGEPVVEHGRVDVPGGQPR